MDTYNILETHAALTKEMKKEFYLTLRLAPLPGRRFILIEDYTIGSFTIPKGFVSNGANIPRIAWFIYPPFDPKNLPFIMLHDYLCSLADTTEEYKRADRYMLTFSRMLGRGRVGIVFYTSVSLYTRYGRPLLKRLGLYKSDKLTAFVRKSK
jgi:hypothetical protein